MDLHELMTRRWVADDLIGRFTSSAAGWLYPISPVSGTLCLGEATALALVLAHLLPAPHGVQPMQMAQALQSQVSVENFARTLHTRLTEAVMKELQHMPVIASNIEITPAIVEITGKFAQSYFAWRLCKRKSDQDLAGQRARAYADVLRILTRQENDVRSEEDQLNDVLDAAGTIYSTQSIRTSETMAELMVTWLREVHDTVE